MEWWEQRNQKERKKVKMTTIENLDNSRLMPLMGCIGCVDEVNGSSAREVPGFSPTKAELLILARHWEHTFLDRAYFTFTHRQIGSTEMRLVQFAERRVQRVINLLGEEAIRAVQEARDEFAKNNPVSWNAFVQYLGVKHLHDASV